MIKKKPLSVVIGLAALGLSSALYAQDAAEEAEAAKITDEDVEEVVVTGSRIIREGAISPTPVTTVTAEDIDLSGNLNLGDFLNDLPALRSTFSGNNSGRFIGTVGLNLLDLRGMGTARTLVLQDGRRHIAASIGTSSVNVNTIPEDLLERVDVITGGASAVYGADAVTGVVNFITKDDFEGTKVSTYSSATDNGGGDATELSVTWGRNFFDERANVAVSVQTTQTDEVYGYERDWITDGKGFLFNPENTGPDDGIPDRIQVNNYSAPILNETGVIWPAAWLGVGPSNFVTFNADGTAKAMDFGTQCDSRPRCSGGDGYQWVGQNQMYPEMEDVNFFAKGHFDINDSTRVFAEAKYVQNEARSFGQASFGLNIFSVDNPFLDPVLRDQLVAEGMPIFGMYRMHTDLGYRGNVADRETQRYVLGVKGDLGSSWNYETSLVYGQYDATVDYSNNRWNERFNQAIDAVVDPATGEIVCADADARAAGCQPLNLFGFGQSSQEAVDWVMLQNTGSTEEMSQLVWSSSISGAVIELPAGALQVAGGLEYREEQSAVDYDEIIKNGETFMNALAPTDGEYDVSEAFVEASVPLLADLPGVQDLTFDTAYRVSDYSTVGRTSAWKTGLDWTVTEDLRIRATASEAVRAPNIDELFAPLGQNFFSVTDPCDSREIQYAPDPALRAANCRALGLDPDTFLSTLNGVTLAGFSGGNVNLDVETGMTETIGAVFTPRWVEGLTITVDYWDMEVEDAISYYSGQTILDKCVDGASINNAFCGNQTRGADGQLTSVTSSALNAASLTARGIDYELRYNFDVPTFGTENAWGDLTVSVIGTRLLERDDYSFQDDPTSADRIDGELGDPESNWVSNVTYRLGDFSLNWRHEYIGSMLTIDFLDGKESRDVYSTGTMRYNDLQARYMLDMFGNALEVYGGVNNLEDTAPPAGLSGIGGGSGMYDTYGRSYYLGFNYSFQ
ncbi:TonB-dependent receptor plug domain-containing protein [Biformimicrobium ophioploci]|uniref:TonB-dependent receptor n=1 Tax=Biformimicrobium ophioploci TaxID=3036711 RepID=A0ABQ6LV09_9GAMM|nr:TonB-dependent receptor [Microbulbifer sp. NKW57]GMG85938.1 TonB-dependent receptor [Microbulbifer sp. NKW57]